MSMLVEKNNDDDYNVVRAVVQKERSRIIELLQKNKAMNISEIAAKTKLDRATVSYHLDQLENLEIVESEYEMLKGRDMKGKFGRYYSLNCDKYAAVISSIIKKFEKKRNEIDPSSC